MSPDNRQFGVAAQIRVIQDVPLFRCKVKRVAVGRLLAAVERIDLVVGILHPLAPVQERTEEVHDVDDGRVGQRLGLMVDEHTSGIKFGMFLTQQVFICDIIPGNRSSVPM